MCSFWGVVIFNPFRYREIWARFAVLVYLIVPNNFSFRELLFKTINKISQRIPLGLRELIFTDKTDAKRVRIVTSSMCPNNIRKSSRFYYTANRYYPMVAYAYPTTLLVPTVNVGVVKLLTVWSVGTMNNNLSYFSHLHTSSVCLSPAS